MSSIGVDGARHGTKRRLSEDTLDNLAEGTPHQNGGDHKPPKRRELAKHTSEADSYGEVKVVAAAGEEARPGDYGDGSEGESQEEVVARQEVLKPCVKGRDDEYYKTLYTQELDFRLLKKKHPDFAAVLEHGGHLDFGNPRSVMQLTKTLLKVDFGISIDLPPDRLCPPVPNRHNYILWLKDLLDSTGPLSSGAEIFQTAKQQQDRKVTGLDIGTGASLIYPLLGCAQRASWTFIATDVDAKSLNYARRNLELNSQYKSRVRIVERPLSPDAPLIPLDEMGIKGAIDFVMVNPPFYTSETELLSLAAQKARPPHSACTGAPVEMVCQGGEVAFVQRLIQESLALRGRVKWYTAMLGKQSSLEGLVDVLKTQYHISNYAVTTFVQGSKTRRWGLGWSFGDRRPSLSANRGHYEQFSVGNKRILPWPTEMVVFDSSRQDFDQFSHHAEDHGMNVGKELQKSILDSMANLDLTSWGWDGQRQRGIGFAEGNVWGRAYRRRKRRTMITTESQATEHHHSDVLPTDARSTAPEIDSPTIQQETPHYSGDCAFSFAITIQGEEDKFEINGKNRSENDDIEKRRKFTVTLRWFKGNDYMLFESFGGLLRNTLVGRISELQRG